uniref:Peptidase aspartic putative domain-containing protein n=1 Tax=Anopheles quadriannulatus TaxID=34691 RepID=A0A182WYE8_ANOQN
MKKDSYESLIHILDNFERSVNITKQLGVATEGWSVLLAHMLHSRLDSATQMHWEAHHRSTDVSEYHELLTFLKSHALVLQAMVSPAQKKEQHTSSWKQRSKKSYDELMLEAILKLVPEKVMLQNTELGWIVFGRVELERRLTSSIVNLVCTNQDLENLLTKFCEIESCYTNNTMYIEETSCEKVFSETTTRDDQGRFIVTLPTKKDKVPQLGNSMFNWDIWKKSRNNIRTLTHPFITYRINVFNALITTKLRVVFDASCATDSGISLNDTLMVGPVVQDDWSHYDSFSSVQICIRSGHRKDVPTSMD